MNRDRHAGKIMKLLLTASLLALATPAFAGPITVTGVQTDRTEVITVNSPLPSPLTANVGRLKLTTSAGDLFAWCIDLFHEISTGGGQNLAYTTGPVTTNNNGTPLTTLQKHEIAGLIAYGNGLLSTAAGTTSDSAATQLAIWSVEYPTFSFSGASAATSAETASLLALAPSLAGSAGALIALNGTQGLAFEVDAPPSAALLLGALPALAWLRRRRG